MFPLSTLWLLPAVWLLSLSGTTLGSEHGPEVVRVVVKEGDDSILPCSLSSKENIVDKLFDWKRDGQKEVFLYDGGVHYNNGRVGQDEQFKGRVSHFPEQLKFGNASITIRNTKLTDSGTFTCDFPRLWPEQIFYIELVVEPVFKDRSGENRVAVPKPNITIFDVTNDGVVLLCEVQGAALQPTLQWKDSEGNLLPAEEPQVSAGESCYNITLLTTVTSTATNCFHCVLKQEKINHVIDAKITVSEKLFQEKSSFSATVFISGCFCGILIVAVPLVLVLVIKYIRKRSNKDSCQELNGSVNRTESPLMVIVGSVRTDMGGKSSELINKSSCY